MKNNDKNRAVIAESIAKSWKDSDHKAKLISDPVGTLKSAGASIEDGHKVTVLENTPNLIHAVLPTAGSQGGHQGAIDSALEELRNLPEGVEVRVQRDSENHSIIALPAAPSGDLSDADLEQVAGGKGGNNEATQTQTTQTQTMETTSTEVAEAEVGVAAAVAVVVVPCFIS
ncbi:MAG: hypothetical protein CL917_03580 [Deltaproteobacteria bacterium]|nr:hypothetical protein [Deltaproteobacteria bacterium]